MTTPTPDWHTLTPPTDRTHRSTECSHQQHAPQCEGYYPPGRDTYRCLCACHQTATTSLNQAYAEAINQADDNALDLQRLWKRGGPTKIHGVRPADDGSILTTDEI